MVGAGRAKLGRLAAGGCRFRRGVSGKNAAHSGHIKLAEAVHLGLGVDGDAGGAERIGDDGIALLHDEGAGHTRGEGPDRFDRQRIDEADLQEAGVRGGLDGVHIRDAAGHDADASVASTPLDPIERARLAPLRDLGELGSQAPVGRTGVGRDHDPTVDVVLEMRQWNRRRGSDIGARRDDRLGVTDSGRHSEQDRDVPLLRHLDGTDEEVVRLLAIGGLDHRQPGRDRVASVVLLVL